METPEPPFERKPRPLGFGFFVLMLAPIVVMVALTIFTKSGLGGLRAREVAIAVCPSLVCAAWCGIIAYRRSNRVSGFLTFVGLLALYGAAFFVGCAATYRIGLTSY
jgi:hypothetical protein